MAAVITEALNATGMGLTLWCGSLSYAGFGISGSWVGTIKFYGTTDGLNFQPISVTPFASGTDVTSTTANGSWFIPARNYLAVRVVFTRTSGTAIVKLAASTDSSYQDAFLASTSKFVNTTATGGANTTTITAQANRAWRLRTLIVSADTTPTWAASPNVKVTDGASTIIWALDLPATAGVYNVPLPADSNTPGLTGGGVVGTAGSSMVITVASGAGSVKTNVNAELTAA